MIIRVLFYQNILTYRSKYYIPWFKKWLCYQCINVKFNQCIIKLKTMSTIMFLFWTKPMSSSEYTPRIRAHIIIVIIYSICKVNLTFFVLIRYACNTFCMKIWIHVSQRNVYYVRRSLEWKHITVCQHYILLNTFLNFWQLHKWNISQLYFFKCW